MNILYYEVYIIYRRINKYEGNKIIRLIELLGL